MNTTTSRAAAQQAICNVQLRHHFADDRSSPLPHATSYFGLCVTCCAAAVTLLRGFQTISRSRRCRNPVTQRENSNASEHGVDSSWYSPLPPRSCAPIRIALRPRCECVSGCGCLHPLAKQSQSSAIISVLRVYAGLFAKYSFGELALMQCFLTIADVQIIPVDAPLHLGYF